MEGSSFHEWFRSPQKSTKNGFVVWKSLLEAFLVIKRREVQKIGDSSKVRIEKDPWVGVGNHFKFSKELVDQLHE